MEKYIYQEKSIELGDKRLNKRYAAILEKSTKQASCSIPATFKNWHQTKAVYRFFDNEKVTHHALLAHHYQQTWKHIEYLDDQQDILLIQDTTDVNYNRHSSKKELGKMHSNLERGLRIHPTLAVGSNGLNLGLVHARIWTRASLNPYVAKHRLKQRPAEEKESYRWIESLRVALQVGKRFPAKKVFNVADREADMYDLLLESTSSELENVYFIVRMAQNRRTDDVHNKLYERLEQAPVIGKISFEYQQAGKKSRQVTQKIKSRLITVKSPASRSDESSVSLYGIYTVEENPPHGQQGLSWLLLTDYPVKDQASAAQILRYYMLRWRIEVYFKVLKSGCKIEALRLESNKRLMACLAMYMIVGCRVMFLLRLGNLYPSLSSSVVFSDFEWQAAHMAIHGGPPPAHPPPLGKTILCIVQLGGYLNRKHDPPAGPQAMWLGLHQLTMIAEGVKMGRTYG